MRRQQVLFCKSLKCGFIHIIKVLKLYIRRIVEDKLAEYNETNAVMNIVLFDQAIEHVCRICRIIDLPRGNALLVGSNPAPPKCRRWAGSIPTRR